MRSEWAAVSNRPTPTWGQPRQRRNWGRRPELGGRARTWRTLRYPSSPEKTRSCSMREPGRERPPRLFWTGWAVRGCWQDCRTVSPWPTSGRRPGWTRWRPRVGLPPIVSPVRTFSGVSVHDLNKEEIPEITIRYIGGGGRYKVSCQNLIDKYSTRSESLGVSPWKAGEYSKSCSNLQDLDWSSSQTSTGMRRSKSYSRITEEKSCLVSVLRRSLGDILRPSVWIILSSFCLSLL